jgi:hypothetical protein
LFLILLMTNHEMILCIRISTKCLWRNLLKFFKRNLNYVRLYLNKGKSGIFMVITYEQGVLTSFLKLDGLELILVKFPRILVLWIINYELIINYQRLTINYVINN